MNCKTSPHPTVTPLPCSVRYSSRAQASGLGRRILLLCLWGAVLAGPAAAADYYVAPAALGSGSGTSAANAADYRSSALWSTAGTAVQSGAVTVWFTNGTYTAGTLDLVALGHPLNLLTLRATTDYLVTLRADSSSRIVNLRGVQNITIQGINFTGGVSQSGVVCQRDGKIPCRFVKFYKCKFLDLNLTSATGGAALQITTGSVDMTVDNCDFERLGVNNLMHFIYCNVGVHNIFILNSRFTDCTGDYVRFRNDSDFVKVDNCVFKSNTVAYNRPFIDIPTVNDVNPGDEFFGTNFQFTNNEFRYVDYSSGLRYAHYFFNTGYSAPDYDYHLDATESNILKTGTPAQKQTVLNGDMGLSNLRVKIYGSTYHGVNLATVYRSYGSGAGSYTDAHKITDWPGTSGTLYAPPIVRNGSFEFLGERLRAWQIFGPYAPVDYPGLNGTAKAIRLALGQNTEVGQWLNPPSSTTTLHCLFAIGVISGTGVKFKMEVYHNEVTGSRLVVAVDNQGRMGYMNGANFVIVPELGTVTVGTLSNPNWYQLRVVIDYSGATPHFDIARGVAKVVSDYTYSKTGLTGWVGTPPVTGNRCGTLNFVNIAGDAIVDQIW